MIMILVYVWMILGGNLDTIPLEDEIPVSRLLGCIA